MSLLFLDTFLSIVPCALVLPPTPNLIFFRCSFDRQKKFLFASADSEKGRVCFWCDEHDPISESFLKEGKEVQLLSYNFMKRPKQLSPMCPKIVYGKIRPFKNLTFGFSLS